uniref:Uncharacterized protein n=1 Tax=Hyaloperonospora arabidopsidis (strain Emoy2) TaxID=559515 RepID=M4BL43_HYAAE
MLLISKFSQSRLSQSYPQLHIEQPLRRVRALKIKARNGLVKLNPSALHIVSLTLKRTTPKSSDDDTSYIIQTYSDHLPY